MYRINSSISGDMESLKGTLNENLLTTSQRKSNAAVSENFLIQGNQRKQGQVIIIEEEKAANQRAVVSAASKAEEVKKAQEAEAKAKAEQESNEWQDTRKTNLLNSLSKPSQYRINKSSTKMYVISQDYKAIE